MGDFKVGSYVGVQVQNSTYLYKVVNKDLLAYLDSDYASIASGATQAFSEVSSLDPPDNEMYEVSRVRIAQGNVRLVFKQPAAVNRFGTEKAADSGVLVDSNDHLNPNMFLTEDYPPSVQITNSTDVAQTPILQWFGRRYTIVKVDKNEVIKNVARGAEFHILNGTGIGR